MVNEESHTSEALIQSRRLFHEIGALALSSLYPLDESLMEHGGGVAGTGRRSLVDGLRPQ